MIRPMSFSTGTGPFTFCVYRLAHDSTILAVVILNEWSPAEPIKRPVLSRRFHLLPCPAWHRMSAFTPTWLVAPVSLLGPIKMIAIRY
jgi:hypothetical protein